MVKETSLKENLFGKIKLCFLKKGELKLFLLNFIFELENNC